METENSKSKKTSKTKEKSSKEDSLKDSLKDKSEKTTSKEMNHAKNKKIQEKKADESKTKTKSKKELDSKPESKESNNSKEIKKETKKSKEHKNSSSENLSSSNSSNKSKLRVYNKYNFKKPEKECNDPNCVHHGHIKARGRIFKGVVIADKMHKTVTIELTRREYIAKYERYLLKRTRIKAHNPPCIDAKIGDIVKIVETRPISKTKNFVVVEKE